MGTYTQILYQLVFSTKERERTLVGKANVEMMYRYIWGVINKKKCHLYRIGGVEDHIHIIISIHPTVAPAMLVKDIKIASSKYIKSERLFSNFGGWQSGYGAFTYHTDSKDGLIEYVKNQEDHHRIISFKNEYVQLLKDHGIDFDEKYLF